MSPQLATVLEIAAVGAALLFAAFAGLVGLLYLLTTPGPFARPAAPASEPPVSNASATQATTDPTAAGQAAQESEERDRQRRAVAVAVAVACAERGRVAVSEGEAPPEWQRLQRARRLNQPRSRARARNPMRGSGT